MNTILILAGVYLIVFPVLFRLIAFAQKKLVVQRAMAKASKNTNPDSLPQPVWPKWKERISFGVKDTRAFVLSSKKEPSENAPKNRQVYLMMYLAGLVVMVASYFVSYWLVPVAFVIFLTTVFTMMSRSKGILEQRKDMMNTMFSIAQSNLGVSASASPNEVVQVMEWADIVTPNKIRFNFSKTTSESVMEPFLRQFNLIFGQENAWVAFSDPEGKEPGWNFPEGRVTIASVPPLPGIAKFHERYVLHPGVSWSVFPIGLAVEGGIEIPNEETGEIEHIAGFDVSGNASKVAKKAGLPAVGKPFAGAAAPQILVGGGTGGGKAVASNTPVLVKKRKSDQ